MHWKSKPENNVPKLDGSALPKDEYAKSKTQDLQEKLRTNEKAANPAPKFSFERKEELEAPAHIQRNSEEKNEEQEMLMKLQRNTEVQQEEGHTTLAGVKEKTDRIRAGSGEIYTEEEREILKDWADGAMNTLAGMKKNIRSLFKKASG